MNRIIQKFKTPTSWHELTTILVFRLIALFAFLAILSTVMPSDNIAFYAFMGFSFIATIPYSLWIRKQDLCKQFASLQFTVDLVTVSGLIYFTGGLDSDLNVLFPLVILSAGLVSTPKQTIQITALSIIIYTLLITLMSNNILAPALDTALQPPEEGVARTLAIRILVFLFFGIASTYLARRCCFINQKEEQLRGMTEIIFRNIHTGLLLLDEKKTILLTNPRACKILQRSAQELAGMQLDQLVDTTKSHPADPFQKTVYFSTKDGTSFPAAYEESCLSLPSEAIPQLNGHGGDAAVQIISFKDVSVMLAAHEQNQQVERMQAAADMAAEVAHEIRTPLTAISGAVQLLNYLDTHEPSQPDEALSQSKKELLQQIFQQSTRIDKVIQHFLDYAEFSHDDLAQLMDIDLTDTSS